MNNTALILHPRPLTIYALLFQIDGSQLIVRPDQYGHSPYARPKRRSDTMLDVRAFQEILWAGERREQELVVTEVHSTAAAVPPRTAGLLTVGGRGWTSEYVAEVMDSAAVDRYSGPDERRYADTLADRAR